MLLDSDQSGVLRPKWTQSFSLCFKESDRFYGVKILIEDAETQEYLASEGRWTKKPDEGASFATTRAACMAAKRESIGKFNIVWYSGDTKQLINLDRGSGKGK